VSTLGAIVSGLSLAALVTGYLLRERRNDRLRHRLTPPVPTPPAPFLSERENELGRSADQITGAAGLHRVGAFYGSRLARAGIYSPWAGSLYTAAKVLSIVVLALAWMWLSDPLSWSAARISIFAGSLLAAAFLPDFFLWSRLRRRRMNLQHGLPEWLDLHTTLVEGGLSFDAALARIVLETEGTKEPIFQEVGIAYREILLGASRATALRRMADRTRVEEIDQIVTALVHADQLGTGVANALRPQADMIRNRIWEEARARAERLGTKLLFPIFMGSLPVFFVLLVLPLFLRALTGLRGMFR
jgi:tight adherence protein C